MRKRNTAILVDTGCDVPQSFIQKYNIKVLRLRLSYGDEHYLDSVELASEVYRRFPGEIPHTSTPTMQDYYDMIEEIKAEGYENVIGVFISSKLSSTCHTAQMVFREHPELNSFILDSKNISIGAGLLAMWAAVQIDKKVPYEEVCKGLEHKVADSKVFFYMDTLEYLRKGGRIGGVTAVAGSLLKIKPIISCDKEGVYYTVAKIRGAKAGIEKIVSLVEEKAGGKPAWLALMNGAAADTAAQVRPLLKKRIKKGSIVADSQIAATLAVNTGPGLLGIGVLENP
ncbi:MAG: DegV family protein [Eubacteriales bacterium]|nr:DegV family protein [Eubacteriales bacterium]